MTEQMAIEYLLNRYLVVGSPVNPPKEECEKQNAVIDMAIQALEKQSMVNEILNELKQYRAIGTVEELQALKEKSVAKKPYEGRFGVLRCPSCDEKVGQMVTKTIKEDCMNYCGYCGTKIDWE